MASVNKAILIGNLTRDPDVRFMPNSHAVQFLVFGGSTTGTQSLNAICVAYQLGQHEVVERMACNADAAYRKANPNCGE